MTAAGARRPSLRRQLMIGILLPVFVFVLINTVSLYRQALRAADTAYDRTLLASAKSIGEQLEVVGSADQLRLQATVLYSALEPFEADNRSRMFYKVTGFAGEMVSGFEDLPRWQGTLPVKGQYAALVDFYDDRYRDQPVRVAVLLQPVAGVGGQGMATVQVAETLELRQTLARQILVDTLWRQALLVALIAAIVVWVVQRATRPVREIGRTLRERGEGDLAPLQVPRAPRELQPLLDGLNLTMGRLARLLQHQKRFVRDASHQLRTPLAVLKTQTQSAMRGDIEPQQALVEINSTIDRATQLANQMLALARVEQLRAQGDAPTIDWAEVARAVALDLSALIAERRLDFTLDARPAAVRAHEWALRELTRNLLHNAIQHSRPGELRLRLSAADDRAELVVSDSGPGLSDEQRERLFQPFSGSSRPDGFGLGLAICQEIVHSLEGTLSMRNRMRDGRICGLDAVVTLPLAHNPA
jgi:two-component system sensor histidine kinase TctE